MYVDLNIGTVDDPNNQRLKLNAKDAETLSGMSLDELKTYFATQSDWNQTDEAALDFIKNKPVLAPVAKSGLIEDLEMLWDTMLIFDGGDAGSHEPIALVGTTKLV
jgi:hypothetical protein